MAYGIALVVIFLSAGAHVCLGCTSPATRPDSSSSESDRRIVFRPTIVNNNTIELPPPPNVTVPPTVTVPPITESTTTAPPTTTRLPCESECFTSANLLLTPGIADTNIPEFTPSLATLNCDGAAVARVGDTFAASCEVQSDLKVDILDAATNVIIVDQNFGFTCIENVGWVYAGPGSFVIAPSGNTLECDDNVG